MKIISVIPLKKGVLKGDLTYFTKEDILPGNIVTVPVRNQKTLALVTQTALLKDTKSDVKGMDFNLRKVEENLGASIFLPEYLDAIFEISAYFVGNKGNAIGALIPSIFIEKYEKLAELRDKKENSEKNNPITEKNITSEKLLFQYPFPDRISIYKTLVRESFARGKSIFVVLPTESDIIKFETLLAKGIEQFTYSLHSGISSVACLATYEKIVLSDHPVLVLCTAPYLSIPLKNIGTIILEHENSGAYRMIGRPYFDLRTFVELYAAKTNAKLIMADELLRFETIGRLDMDHMAPLHPLSFRLDFPGTLEIAERVRQNRSGEVKPDGKKKFQLFEDKSMEEIRSALQNKQNVFIFSLRKGLATQTLCRDCGETVSCNACGAPLVLHLSHQGKKRMFVCNRCEEEKDSDMACSACGSWNLVPLGIGTDTVHEAAEKLFPKTNIYKMDKESVKTGKAAKDIIKDWSEQEGAILVGTEMAFFYMKKSVPLSVIASFDSLWSIPNFRMSEKIIQIVLSTLSVTENKLVIQTKNGNDPVLRAIRAGNLMPYVREELNDRKKLSYPPFRRFIKIRHVGDREQTTRAQKYLEENLAPYSPEIFSGFVSRLKGKYVTNALIKMDPGKWSLPEITAGGSIDENLLMKLSSLPPQFEIVVDPEDLL